MFEDADNFADLFRGGLPYYILITLPILIICSSNPVLASSEFNVHRMSQYDVLGTPYGCRASALNLEARSLHTWTTSRHCIITRFQDLAIDQFHEIRTKAGGLIILLPQKLPGLSKEEQEHIFDLEQAFNAQDISIPVYFSKYNEELNEIVEEVSRNKDGSDIRHESALTEIINSISANGYQFAITNAHHAPQKQPKIPIIQGELYPGHIIPANKATPSADAAPVSSRHPLIVITAHLDTFGLIQGDLINTDAAILLTLVDAFNKIYQSPLTSPKYRIQFLLTESGSILNFQGTKRWLDTNYEETEWVNTADFVLCLDAIGRTNLDGGFFMHVSKPPKEGTHVSRFYKQLKQTAQRYANISVEGVHKKINLADVQLAWEHERFSMKRVPAFTLSALKSHKDAQRTTIFERSSEVSLAVAQRNAKILAETLAAYIYGAVPTNDTETTEIFSGATAITEESLRPWLYAHSLLVNNDLKNAFEKYLKNVKVTYDRPDAREPDFMLYEGYDGVLNIYSVKPAVFDLFLTIVIVAYLAAVYFAIFNFAHLYSAICKITNNNNSNAKIKVN